MKDDSGQWHNARMKGVFKIDNITSTNPVAVGDEVEIDLDGEAMIVEIHPSEYQVLLTVVPNHPL